MDQARTDAPRSRSKKWRGLPVWAAYLLVLVYLFCPVVVGFLKLPAGQRIPEDPYFWTWSLPIWGMAVGAFGVSRLFSYGSIWRERATQSAIPMFLCAVFYTGNLYLSDAASSVGAPLETVATVEPENNYTCTRKADGGFECLNEFGEPDPNYSYTEIDQNN